MAKIENRCPHCGKLIQDKFKKPTIEQCAEYAKSIGFTTFDAEYYYATQEKIGWCVKIGNTFKPMASWKGSIRTWFLAAKRRGEIKPKSETFIEKYDAHKNT